MGHEIKYFVYNENEDRRKIMDEIQEYARGHGDGYSSYVIWHENTPPCDSYDDAKRFIDELDKGNYDDHAVRYHDYRDIPDTPRIKKLQDYIRNLRQAKAEWNQSHSVRNFKAQYIGCPKCGSKLSREHLRGEHCPLCSTELRAAYVLEKMDWYDQKINTCYNAIQEERKKQKKQAKVMWLVKFEFHN